MEYLQIKNGEALQITTHGNVEWDENNYCSAAALVRDGKAEQFDVHPLTVTEPPLIDPMTQAVIRDGCELVNGQWQYKWRIDDLTAEQIEDRRKAAVPQKVSRAQFILALLQLDLLDGVEAAIAAADRATQINYKERLEFERNYPLMLTMAAVLGKTERELDDLFVLAATL
jgi:hypothetical protein